MREGLHERSLYGTVLQKCCTHIKTEGIGAAVGQVDLESRIRGGTRPLHWILTAKTHTQHSLNIQVQTNRRDLVGHQAHSERLVLVGTHTLHAVFTEELDTVVVPHDVVDVDFNRLTWVHPKQVVLTFFLSH